MAISKTIQFGFRIDNDAPIDTRFIAANAAERVGIPQGTAYKGLLCYQQDTEILYVLVDPSDPSQASSWEEFSQGGGGGGGTSYQEGFGIRFDEENEGRDPDSININTSSDFTGSDAWSGDHTFNGNVQLGSGFGDTLDVRATTNFVQRIKLDGQASDPSDSQSEAGMIYYNTTSDQFRFYNGTEWENIGSESPFHIETFDPDGEGWTNNAAVHEDANEPFVITRNTGELSDDESVGHWHFQGKRDSDATDYVNIAGIRGEAKVSNGEVDDGSLYVQGMVNGNEETELASFHKRQSRIQSALRIYNELEEQSHALVTDKGGVEFNNILDAGNTDIGVLFETTDADGTNNAKVEITRDFQLSGIGGTGDNLAIDDDGFITRTNISSESNGTIRVVEGSNTYASVSTLVQGDNITFTPDADASDITIALDNTITGGITFNDDVTIGNSTIVNVPGAASADKLNIAGSVIEGDAETMNLYDDRYTIVRHFIDRPSSGGGSISDGARLHETEVFSTYNDGDSGYQNSGFGAYIHEVRYGQESDTGRGISEWSVQDLSTDLYTSILLDSDYLGLESVDSSNNYTNIFKADSGGISHTVQSGLSALELNKSGNESDNATIGEVTFKATDGSSLEDFAKVRGRTVSAGDRTGSLHLQVSEGDGDGEGLKDYIRMNNNGEKYIDFLRKPRVSALPFVLGDILDTDPLIESGSIWWNISDDALKYSDESDNTQVVASQAWVNSQNFGDEVSINANIDQILSVSDGEISAVDPSIDAGNIRFVIWDQPISGTAELTYAEVTGGDGISITDTEFNIDLASSSGLEIPDDAADVNNDKLRVKTGDGIEINSDNEVAIDLDGSTLSLGSNGISVNEAANFTWDGTHEFKGEVDFRDAVAIHDTLRADSNYEALNINDFVTRQYVDTHTVTPSVIGVSTEANTIANTLEADSDVNWTNDHINRISVSSNKETYYFYPEIGQGNPNSDDDDSVTFDIDADWEVYSNTNTNIEGSAGAVWLRYRGDIAFFQPTSDTDATIPDITWNCDLDNYNFAGAGSVHFTMYVKHRGGSSINWGTDSEISASPLFGQTLFKSQTISVSDTGTTDLAFTLSHYYTDSEGNERAYSDNLIKTDDAVWVVVEMKKDDGVTVNSFEFDFSGQANANVNSTVNFPITSENIVDEFRIETNGNLVHDDGTSTEIFNGSSKLLNADIVPDIENLQTDNVSNLSGYILQNDGDGTVSWVENTDTGVEYDFERDSLAVGGTDNVTTINFAGSAVTSVTVPQSDNTVLDVVLDRHTFSTNGSDMLSGFDTIVSGDGINFTVDTDQETITISADGIDVRSSDPGTPSEGDVWYNTTDDRIKYAEDSSTVREVVYEEELNYAIKEISHYENVNKSDVNIAYEFDSDGGAEEGKFAISSSGTFALNITPEIVNGSPQWPSGFRHIQWNDLDDGVSIFRIRSVDNSKVGYYRGSAYTIDSDDFRLFANNCAHVFGDDILNDSNEDGNDFYIEIPFGHNGTNLFTEGHDGLVHGPSNQQDNRGHILNGINEWTENYNHHLYFTPLDGNNRTIDNLDYAKKNFTAFKNLNDSDFYDVYETRLQNFYYYQSSQSSVGGYSEGALSRIVRSAGPIDNYQSGFVFKVFRYNSEGDLEREDLMWLDVNDSIIAESDYNNIFDNGSLTWATSEDSDAAPVTSSSSVYSKLLAGTWKGYDSGVDSNYNIRFLGSKLYFYDDEGNLEEINYEHRSGVNI